MSALKRIRKALEVVLVRIGLLFIPMLPRRGVVRLARVAGWLGYYLSPRLRNVGKANLDIAFQEHRTPREKKKILQESFQTFALVTLDILWFSRHSAKRIPAHVRFDPGLDEVFQHKPHICITAHLGNWELLGHAVSLKGYPLHSVAAPLANPAVEPLFHQIRSVSGQRILARNGAVRGMLKALKAKEKVGLLLDQNIKPSKGGVFLDFFGLPAPVSDAAATLALRTQTDILFGFCIPDRDGSYYVHTAEKITPDRYASEEREQAVRACTFDIVHVIENAIRTHPGAWLWMYKRWKYRTPGVDPNRYPFYAGNRKKAVNQ